jgi:organic hydroperoxide reductase OsmC/OhrA
MNVARRCHTDAGDVAVDSKISLLSNGEGGFVLAVTLDETLSSVEGRGTAVALIKEAHMVCPYSIATRGNIDVEFLLAGTPI